MISKIINKIRHKNNFKAQTSQLNWRGILMEDTMISKIINKIRHKNNFKLQPPQLNWHENFIVELTKTLQPKLYVELGIYNCTLFNRLIPYCDRLIGVDISAEAGEHMTKSPKTKFNQLSTVEFATELSKCPEVIDLLFIDADHSKEAVLQDFNNFFPYMADHGIILLHDSHPGNYAQLDKGYCGDGYLAIEALSKNTIDYEMMTIPVAPGLTICRKRHSQLNWVNQ